MTEAEFLTQAAAQCQQMVTLCKTFLTDNPDSDYAEWAEDCLEECAGEGALLTFWMGQMETPAAVSAAAPAARTKSGAVYLK